MYTVCDESHDCKLFSSERTMNMNEFKAEFSQLLLRYAAAVPPVDNKNSEMETLLSNQQILDTVHEVLKSTLNVNLHNVDATLLKTPVNDFVIATPHAPDVLRVDYNQNSSLFDRYKSLEVLTFEMCNESRKYSCPMKPICNQEKIEVLDSTESSPSNGCVTDNKEKKSETSLLHKILHNQLETVAKGNEHLKQKIKSAILKLDSIDSNILCYMIEEAHRSAVVAMNKIEDLKELLMPETRPNRRLSTIMNLPSAKQQCPSLARPRTSLSSGSSLRTIQRAKALRRSVQQEQQHHRQASLEPVPGTPTSSRPCRASLGVAAPAAQARKVAGALGDGGGGGARGSLKSLAPGAQPAHLPSPKEPSKSSLAGPADACKSPIRKNPKYAHVQSTIPKQTHLTLKRKAQEKGALSPKSKATQSSLLHHLLLMAIGVPANSSASCARTVPVIHAPRSRALS